MNLACVMFIPVAYNHKHNSIRWGSRNCSHCLHIHRKWIPHIVLFWNCESIAGSILYMDLDPLASCRCWSWPLKEEKVAEVNFISSFLDQLLQQTIMWQIHCLVLYICAKSSQETCSHALWCDVYGGMANKLDNNQPWRRKFKFLLDTNSDQLLLPIMCALPILPIGNLYPKS